MPFVIVIMKAWSSSENSLVNDRIIENGILNSCYCNFHFDFPLSIWFIYECLQERNTAFVLGVCCKSLLYMKAKWQTNAGHHNSPITCNFPCQAPRAATSGTYLADQVRHVGLDHGLLSWRSHLWTITWACVTPEKPSRPPAPSTFGARFLDRKRTEFMRILAQSTNDDGTDQWRMPQRGMEYKSIIVFWL